MNKEKNNSSQTIQMENLRLNKLLIQIVHINHCIQSRSGNYGSLTMHIYNTNNNI